MVDTKINVPGGTLTNRDGALVTCSDDATSDGLLEGANTLSTTPEVLAASAAVKEVLVQADPANSANVLIGNEDGQHVILAAGDSIVLPVSDLALIYVKAATGTPTVNWIART